ncbi:M4 family metallopeptidase [Actinocrispum wychmicini]|uniref:Zn-dependent metalloprotease n=1 Tax=Actinocrispum wychmicini TaxID=1213861 RepID=A0A4R2JYB6_9PSEU|nr:M4 family metallopeptidase [Actinocrispum wychmicini]TCO62376.1 Zn-dependent metalloprotease [Actinocrispum wychmicini]
MKVRPAAVLTAAFSLVVGAIAGTATAAPMTSPAPLTADALAVNAAAAVVATDKAALHASNDDQFVQHPVISTGNMKYVPYDRTYKGMRVYGGDFVVATNLSGQVVATSVAQEQTISLASTTPKLTAQQAQAIARTEAGKTSKVDSVGGAELLTYALGTPRLAYEVGTTGRDSDGPSKLSVYVDANTGQVVKTQEHVMHGDGNTAWNGPKPVHLDTTQSGSTFSLRDPAHPTEQCQDAANNTTFSKSTDSFGNGNATSKETGCADAFFDIQVENKMLAQWLNRNSFDGNGGGWPIRVGLNDLNAFYDGTQVQIGHNQQNQWISSLDVVGHEHGHGIDDHTPGGISGNGTQEFVADVFGAATEGFANEPSGFDTPDYLVGETINLVGQGPIRNMFNPSALGHKNCYDNQIPSTEVHAAAGPGNHWFYLVAEGTNPTDGQPTSTTCNGSTVTGLGLQNAMKIFYAAMQLKTSASSYLLYRTWTLTAAKNFTPGDCTSFNTVKAAWDAVSVPAQPGDPTCNPTGGNPVVNNPGNQSTVINTPVNLQLTATGGTTPYTWTGSGLPAGLSISPSGLISGTPNTIGNSNVTVTVSDSSNPKKTGSASFTWAVTQISQCTSPGQKFTNPGFESGATGWTATPAVIGANGSQQPTHGGTQNAWLDGYGTTHTDSLSQSVAIPANCKASLTFFLHIDTDETTTTTQFDKLTVTAGSTTLGTFSNLNAANGYVQKTFDVSSFAGQTVTIKWNAVEDASLQTSFVIDDTALTAS